MKKHLLLLIILLSFCETFSQNTWTQKADIPPAAPQSGRSHAVGFSIGNKGYIGTGYIEYAMSAGYKQDFWEWDQATNVWTQKADFGGGIRRDAVGFSIGNKGYIGTGMDGSSTFKKDLWEWNQPTNTWAKKADLPVGICEAVGFSIGNKGYIGTGKDGSQTALKNLWEWNQPANTWTQKANLGGMARLSAVGFSIGTKGYVGTGAMASGGQWGPSSGPMNDFWEWDQVTDAWTQKANFGGPARWAAVGFSIGNKGYIGTGYDGVNETKDFWEWDQAANVWTVKASYPGGISLYGWSNVGEAVGFSIGCYGYIGTGTGEKYGKNDFWEYTPDPMPANCCVLAANVSDPGTVCIGSSVSVTASGGVNYSWSTGAVSATIVVSPSIATTYTVIVSDANGCSDEITVTVPVKNCCAATATISSDPAPNTTFCVGQNVYLASSGGVSYVWSTGDTGANIAATLSVTTTYSVTATDAAGCTGTAAITFIVDTNCTTTGISQLYSNVLQAGIWPNPSNGEFWLSIPSGQITSCKLQITDLEIYNVMGEKITRFQLLPKGGSGWVLDLSSQPDGVYFLQVRTGQGTAAQKLIINK